MWAEIYNRIAKQVASHRTTLVFVNTRRMSERIAHALAERLGEGVVLRHHGSLSRTMRFEAEARLKAGELRALVATASLELGIDIGVADLVIQIGPTRSIAVALQRVGRSGHWVGAKPKGIFMPTKRDEVIECSAPIHAIRSGDLESISIPENAIDILAQQIVAEIAASGWAEDDIYELVRTAYPYRNLERAKFDAVVEMLSEGIATLRGRSGAMLHRGQVNGRIRGRNCSRVGECCCATCCPSCGEWKRAGRFGAAASWQDSRANSSRFRRRSICSARFGGVGKRLIRLTTYPAAPLNLSGIILPGPRISPLSSSIPLLTKRAVRQRYSWESANSA